MSKLTDLHAIFRKIRIKPEFSCTFTRHVTREMLKFEGDISGGNRVVGSMRNQCKLMGFGAHSLLEVFSSSKRGILDYHVNFMRHSKVLKTYSLFMFFAPK